MRRTVTLGLIISLLASSIVYASDAGTVYYDATIKADKLGNYNFEVETHEIPSKEWLPIIDKSYFPVTVENFQTEVDNTAPSATYVAKAISKVDVVFAFGEYSKISSVGNSTSAFKANLNQAGNYIDAEVTEIESAFNSEFALHTTWDTSSDMDTHIYMYDDNNTELIHIYYGNKSGLGLQLDKDDTSGNNDWSEDNTSLSNTGRKDGEWFTMDFPNIPESATRMVIEIHGYSGSSTTTVSLVDKTEEKIVTTSNVAVSHKQYVTIGEFIKDGSGWSFKKADGTLFTGSSALPLGDTLSDVSWRDDAIRVVVHFTDSIPDEMLSANQADYLNTIQKLAGSNVYLINVGNNSNKSYLNKMLNDMAGDKDMGTFILDTTVSSTLNKVAEYIKGLVAKNAKPVSYILVNTEVQWETQYDDYEHDLPLNFGEHDGTKNSDTSDETLATSWGVGLTHLYNQDKILAEKWRYRHNNTYYDNAPIIEAFSGVWLSDPVEIFPNPGKFYINYKRKDNPFYPDVANTNLFDEYRRWSTDYD